MTGGRVIEPKKDHDPYAVEQEDAARAGGLTEPGEPGEPDDAADGFTSGVRGGVLIITLRQSNVLDAFEIETLGDAIYREVKPIEGPKVVIDLSHVEHLSSVALGMLIALRQVVVEKKGGGIAIANVNKDLRSIFKMTSLDKQIPICDSTEKAVRRLG